MKPFDGNRGVYLPAKGERRQLSPRPLILNMGEIEWLLRRSDEELESHWFDREQLIKLHEPS